MPIYEYKCKKCGRQYELFQHINDPVTKTCKFCKGSVTKLMSATSFHLKGSGWYATDYGGSKAPVAETKKEETTKTETTTETAKPESTTKASTED
ncbi:MAG TPA: zinc ribbon domain-containing protein [Syntrophales bacterium]|nr:zinc ribbon domain-containing protein [Syntrophales bacterium]